MRHYKTVLKATDSWGFRVGIYEVILAAFCNNVSGCLGITTRREFQAKADKLKKSF